MLVQLCWQCLCDEVTGIKPLCEMLMDMVSVGIIRRRESPSSIIIPKFTEIHSLTLNSVMYRYQHQWLFYPWPCLSYVTVFRVLLTCCFSVLANTLRPKRTNVSQISSELSGRLVAGATNKKITWLAFGHDIFMTFLQRRFSRSATADIWLCKLSVRFEWWMGGGEVIPHDIVHVSWSLHHHTSCFCCVIHNVSRLSLRLKVYSHSPNTNATVNFCAPFP